MSHAAPGDDVIVLRGKQAGTRGRVIRQRNGMLDLLVGLRPTSVHARDVFVAERRFGNSMKDTGGPQYVDQGLSPLCEAAHTPKMAPEDIYASANTVRRVALVDPSAPAATNEMFFTDKTRTVRYVKGRPLKKPRIHVLPGALPGTVAFIDFHTYGPDALFIDYTAVRPDLRGQKLGQRLARAFYEDAKRQGITFIEWGKVLNDHAWAIMKKMEAEFPSIRSHGKVWF